MNNLKSSWVLFLDRDGVINEKLHHDYVKSWNEFKFLPHVLSTLSRMSPLFKHIFIVTNQQGIGKGLMTIKDVHHIHQKLKKLVRKHGGYIDEIFYCPDLEKDNSPCRKPSIGMGLQAKQKYPGIDFSKSIMVGDSPSDILFGKNLGMITVFIQSTGELQEMKADYVCKDLKEFYLTFTEIINSL